MSRTPPSSSQTVRSSRTSPSKTTRTRRPLGFPERGEEPRQPARAELPLHVPREGAVVRNLLLDLHEFLLEAPPLLLDLLHAPHESLLAVLPAREFELGGLEGVVHRLPRMDLGRGRGGPRYEGTAELEDEALEVGHLLPGVVELPQQVALPPVELANPFLDAQLPLPPLLLFLEGEEDARGVHESQRSRRSRLFNRSAFGRVIPPSWRSPAPGTAGGPRGSSPGSRGPGRCPP